MTDKSCATDAKYEAHKERQAGYQRAISAAGREIGQIPAIVDADRRAKAKESLRLHLLTYHPRAFKLGFSSDHEELIEALQHAMRHGGKLAIAMPRGTGKTTIVTRAMGWGILHGVIKYGILIAATDQKAQKGILQLRREIENGEALIEDFPEACYPVRCLRGITNRQAGQTSDGQPTRMEWGALKLVFPTIENSACSGSIIECGGITGAVSRGPQHVLQDGTVLRPDFCLIDDFQTRESAKSPMQVQSRLDIIEADIGGMAGPDVPMSAVATVTVIAPHDGADQLLNHDLFPHWNGIRKKFLLTFPNAAAMKLWEQYAEIRRQSFQTYRDIRMATEFYKKNRKKMDAGASVSWDAKFLKEAHEISAIQHAMEWFISKPGPFQSELQNAPEETNSSSKQWLKAPEIATKMHHVKQGIVPLGVKTLVSHVDVHDDLLYWTVIGYTPDGTGFVIDYGTYPDQKRRYFMKSQATITMRMKHPKVGLDGAIAQSLDFTLRKLLDFQYESEQGNTMDISLLGVDSGHNPKVCGRAIQLLQQDRRYKNRLTLVKGFGIGPSDIPMAERKVKDGEHLGNNWKELPVPKGNAPQLHVDTNWWKTATNDRFATGIGETGSLTLFHAKDHQLFSEHMASEWGTETQGRGRTVFQFKLLPGRDNHWYDNVVTCGVLASVMHCDTPASLLEGEQRPHRPEPPKKKRRAKVAPLKV